LLSIQYSAVIRKEVFEPNFMDTLPVAVSEKPASRQETSRLVELYIRSASVVSRRIAGETLIVPVRGKVGDLASIYSFNATGTLLWESLSSSQSFADLVEELEREYAVEHEQAANDVMHFLRDAMNAGLVEIQEEVACAAMQSGARRESHLSTGN
jgi:hypothetical protein